MTDQSIESDESHESDTTGTTPLLLATWSFGARAGRDAWRLLAAGGGALDAVECAAIDAEHDPGIDSVGFGGLPDREGGVSLDGCVMLDPRRAGSVCAVRHTRHPVSAARRVMERTDHLMLAGEGADAFALSQGLPAQLLLAPAAGAAWEAWRREPHHVDQSRDGSARRATGLRPVDRGPSSGGALFGAAPGPRVPDDAESRWRHHDTIGVLAIDARGGIAGACSTSGTPYKLPGRVGDSPIIGHGLYVDPHVGAATATGAGELIMGVCGSFLAVELMRAGMSPAAAAAEVVRRIADGGSGASSPDLAMHVQVAVLALAIDGRWGAAALRPGYRTTRWDGSGVSTHEPETVHVAE